MTGVSAVGRIRHGNDGDGVFLGGSDVGRALLLGGLVVGRLVISRLVISRLVFGRLVIGGLVVSGLVVNFLDARVAVVRLRLLASRSRSSGRIARNSDVDGRSGNSDGGSGSSDGDSFSRLLVARLGLDGGLLGLVGNSNGAGHGRGSSGGGGGLLLLGDSLNLISSRSDDRGDGRRAVGTAHGDGNGLKDSLLAGDGGDLFGLASLLSGRRSQGSSSNLAGLVVVDDRRRNLLSLGNRADGLGELDGVGDDVGDSVGLGDRGHARLVSRAVGDGRSTADNGRHLSVNNSQSRLGASGSSSGGGIAAREVHVVAGAISGGNRGQSRDSGNSRLHFDS